MPDLKDVNIRVGTSGYSFEDWKGNFYPAKIDKSKLLEHYQNFFPTVEINMTYYRIPAPMVLHNMVKRTPAGFDFMVKVPQSFTHRRTDLESDVQKFQRAIAPMNETGRLSGLLAQFPYSFKFNQNNLDYINIVRDAIGEIPLFVEFRHDSWVNRIMYDQLKAEKIGYVSVDGPQLKGLLKPDFFTTTDTGYLRLHGRNEEKWWAGGDERYNYKYSDLELDEWKAKLNRSKSKMKELYVFFNNCHSANAALNGIEFQNLIRAYRSID